jgi:hypothetical protein
MMGMIMHHRGISFLCLLPLLFCKTFNVIFFMALKVGMFNINRERDRNRRAVVYEFSKHLKCGVLIGDPE